MINIDAITKQISSFTIVQRIIFIFSIVIVFWILFIIIYLINRLIIRLIRNLEYFHHNSSTISNDKVCQTFVISSNQYGSIRPIQSFNRSDSLFSNTNEKINLTINHYSNIIDSSSQYQQSKSYLLKHYLNTYNPLHIDLIDTNKKPNITTNVNDIFYEEISSLTNTQPTDNCYPINCTNKQKIHQNKRYVRLKEQENCSVIISNIDEQPSQCSTKLTNIILPVVMITDCSNSQRLHTDIIEMNENE
ncbi:unnamed protein product [Rotaria sp. Silwood2]|nr:unnamed protein product [Rotaria sp. Silwood2]CAF3092546.1 unnamed protein product [Rotaria sp. Silwood2]CAF3264229.1 unnamed protein product [Rotaria sp. Silwood2]CAF4051039.1 unnamed protein product [Rotaria sp. Silwood2]CAF4135488.1 unnamed protein product [Rotaria sp. Silwood2]